MDNKLIVGLIVGGALIVGFAAGRFTAPTDTLVKEVGEKSSSKTKVATTKHGAYRPPNANAQAGATPETIDPKHCLGLIKDSYQIPNHWTLTRGDANIVIRPQGALNFNNTEALIQAALQEVGLIYVLDVFVADALAQGRLTQMFPEWETSTRTFHAVTVKSRFASPKVRAFIDFLPEIFDVRRRPDVKSPVAVGPDRRKRRAP